MSVKLFTEGACLLHHLSTYVVRLATLISHYVNDYDRRTESYIVYTFPSMHMFYQLESRLPLMQNARFGFMQA